MNRDELLALSEHLRCLGTKTVRLERYLQRRAWGVYYSIWAASILLFILLPYSIDFISRPYLQLAAYVVSYVVIILIASFSSGLVFSKAKRLASLERNLSENQGDDIKKNSSSGILIFIILIIAIVIIGSGLLKTFIGILLEFAFLAFVDLYVYRMLEKSFDKIPVEGLMAVSFFMFSDIGSAASSLIFRNSEYFGYFWIPAIFAWFLASIYSLYHASDDLVEQADSKECS